MRSKLTFKSFLVQWKKVRCETTGSAKLLRDLRQRVRDSGVSVASWHPGIAGGWLSGKTSLDDPAFICPVGTLRAAWWCCAKCSHNFRARIEDHFVAEGRCPSCDFCPTRSTTYPPLKQKLLSRVGKVGLIAKSPNGVHKSLSSTEQPRRRNLNPMLANSWNERSRKVYLSKHSSEDLIISPKLDGIRCIATFDEKTKNICFFSRAGVLIESADTLVPHLLPLFLEDPLLVLDGELYAHKTFDNFERLLSAVRTSKASQTPQVLQQQEKLQYHIFDLMYSTKQVEARSFTSRVTHVQGLLRRHAVSRTKVQLVEACKVDFNDIDKVTTLYMNQGYEGSIIRRDPHPYRHGVRCNTLMKHKSMNDAEFPIVGFTEGTGKWKGALGSFVCQTKDGSEFFPTPGVDLEQRRELWKRREEYVGKVLTVTFQGMSSYGIPRFPVGKCVRGAPSGEDWL